jgi:hypothetical protein
MISRGSQEDLGLVLQSPEGLRMDDPIPVVLKGRPKRALFFNSLTSPGLRAQGSMGREDQFLLLLQRLANGLSRFHL